ncbi:alcohol dehydrogenase catalytic domain-containing protein [Treponema sp. TIM-1]|uniref:alcohol dehydrogenase catalytic domain-containing protein n=1 Tax=Treponema sp. TIM-1 TaxID=2898417 RepID=UPI00397EA10D
MYGAKLYGANDIRIGEFPLPVIGDDEILLKTSAAAICGTDLRMIANGYKGVDPEHPLVLGHEISGIIEKTGKNVKGYREGMRVALAPNIGCGICDWCVTGDTHLCPDYQAFGINMDGGFAEYVRIPHNAIIQGNIMILDEALPLDTAALFEPMSCVFNGQERTGIRLNDKVLIIGAGPIGIMHALLAKAKGAAEIYIRDISRERMEQCTRLVEGSLPIDAENLEEAVKDLTRGRLMDVCITACPAPAAQIDALKVTGMNGRILFFGGLPAGKEEVTINTNLIHYRQLSIHGSTRGNVRQYREVAKMVMAGNLDLGKLISRRFPLAGFIEAVAYAKKAEGLKTVISFA